MSYPSTENLSNTNALYAVHYTTNNGKELTSSHLYPIAKGGGGHLSVEHQQRDKMSPRNSKKMGKRNIRAQVKKFRMETKAAKTLAIIVGECINVTVLDIQPQLNFIFIWD